jgi:predicted DNA-binding transcriptional regulator YafY
MDLMTEKIGPHASVVCDAASRVCIDYVNWRGERAWRRIIPQRFYFGEVEYHSGRQWIVDAWDVDKEAVRSFAMADVRAWNPDQQTGNGEASSGL